MIALLMAALFMGMYLRPHADGFITRTLDRVLVPLTHHIHKERHSDRDQC
jgi:hypothetical protein